MAPLVLHVILNSHLDPVWLWNRAQGEDVSHLTLSGSSLPATIRGEIPANGASVKCGILNVPASMAASIATALGVNAAFTDTATGRTRAFPIERVPGKGLLPRYTFPSTGHWGDIGFALLRTYQDRAVLELRQHDLIGESIQNKAFRDAVVKDRAGLTVTIPFDSARPEADAVP